MRRQNFMLTHAITADPVYEFASEVRAGLMKPGQKELPSKYLYDDVGSALFEVISVLPEYGLTRADERLLGRYASEIVERLPLPLRVADLGIGSGKKTPWILTSLCRRLHTSYFPSEISRTALAMCARELGDIESMSIVGFEREYLDGLLEVAARRRNGQHLLVLFLGSTIGNFDRPAASKFLRSVREILNPGDSLLLGTDLEKPIPQLIQAYNDPLGVTAAFNVNLLARINRELDGDFMLDQWSHEARFNRDARSIEMHLRSQQNQTVNISRADLSLEFSQGQTIWTESSHKYAPREPLRIARDAGFRCVAQWVDDESALDAFRATGPAAIVLDLRLPSMSGRDVCREIKQQSPAVPVIVLSAASDVSDKVLLLELGADDYVTKPFSPRELLARVRAALRRTTRTGVGEVFAFDAISVDFTKMEVTRDGQPVGLTAQEFKTLKFMVQNAERVISRDELLNEVWGYQNYPSTRTVDNHILKLRQKLERDPANPVHFRTVHGMGYKFVR